jgi:hypothetical protein
VPCHREIGSSGALTGCAGRKVDLKQRLLAIEGVQTQRAHGDFLVRRDAVYVRHLDDAEYCLPTCGSLGREPLSELTLFGSRRWAEAARWGSGLEFQHTAYVLTLPLTLSPGWPAPGHSSIPRRSGVLNDKT